MSLFKPAVLACLVAFGLGPVAMVLAAYEPPKYPQASPTVSSVKIECEPTVQAGAVAKITFDVDAVRKPDSPRRMFVQLIRESQAGQNAGVKPTVMHVAAFPADARDGIAADKFVPNTTTRLGPFEMTLPADIPAGRYRLLGGMYLEKATGEVNVTVNAADRGGADTSIIINTGTFIDKSGVPHRWHVSKTHTLYWDGVPFIPVGGMIIPDSDFNTFKAQIDLLVKNNVRDVYFNVGSSVQMPHTWETKGDEQLRYFQKCVDYMDEKGMRYGMEPSGLQAHGYAYDLMGGKEIAFTIGEPRVSGGAEPNEPRASAGADAGKNQPRLERPNDDEWLKDGVIHAAYRKIHDGYYLITDMSKGRVVASGKIDIVHDERKNREGKDRGQEDQVARVKLPTLPAGEYRLMLTVSQFGDGWNMNMHYWSEDTAKYYQAMRDLYGKIRMGPGFRFIVDAFWNENNYNHGTVPAEETFRQRHAKYLQARYGTIDKLRAAWAVDGENAIADFATAGRLVPMRGIREKANARADKRAMAQTTDKQPVDEGVAWDYLIDANSGKVVRVKQAASQWRYDMLESVGKQVRDFHIEIADLIHGLHDVPVIFKYFSGMDVWHINDAGIAGGHDGVGMETYGLGEPQLTFMGIPALSSCQQSTKTMWLIATEIGEGNHQDQALARNKLMGCTSRLGTMYDIYASLLSGGAKGLYHYYMVPSPGADRFWEDSTMRDPRQLEWMGTFARIVDNAPKLADYEPTVYYRWPALFQPNSGLLFSDPHRDFFNTDCLWWVDPAGKVPNGAWLLPTFSLRVPTDMMFINLENAPATLRWADEVSAYLKRVWDRHPAGPRVTWLGYRKDLGTIPAIDRFYTAEFAKDDDGVEIQVLKPTSDAKVIAANKDGKVWNLMVGNLQIISKNAENKTGWRPDRVVLDGKTHRYDYQTFMREQLGVQRVDCDPSVEAFSYQDGQHRVTVVALRPELDKIIRMGETLPPWGMDATGNTCSPPPAQNVPIAIRGIPENTSASFANGDPIAVPEEGEFDLKLEPDRLTLISSQGKLPWAREGLVFDTTGSHAAAIFRSPANSSAIEFKRHPQATSPDVTPDVIRIEAERPIESNFNLDTFSGLAGLSNDTLLGLATAVNPPTPDGYFARYEFDVASEGTYVLRVREGFLATASPGRWRIDDGPWHDATNTYVPEDIKLVAQYNALEDERMIFAWYTYGQVQLNAGKHRLTYSVVARRPGGLDIGLQNSTPYGKLLDCFEFTPVKPPAGAETPTNSLAGATTPTKPLAASRSSVHVNLLRNPSLEEDTGGWTAFDWTGDRWKWVELRDERGWDRDFWWTKKVGAEGRIFIDKLMDLGGLTVRQSYVGVRSLRIRGGEHPRRFSSQPVAVTPGERVFFGGYLRTEMLHGTAQIRVRILNAEGTECASGSSIVLTYDTHWTNVHCLPVAVPADGRSVILDCCVGPAKPNLTRFGREFRETAWFDDLYLYCESGQ